MLTVFVLTGAIVLAQALPAWSEEIPGEPTGHQIAVNVDEREDGDDQISESTWTLTNKAGKTRIRHTLRYWKDYDGKDGLSSKSFIPIILTRHRISKTPPSSTGPKRTMKPTMTNGSIYRPYAKSVGSLQVIKKIPLWVVT